RIGTGIEHFGLADRLDHSFRGTGIHAGIVPAPHEVGLQAHLLMVLASVHLREGAENVHSETPRPNVAQLDSCSSRRGRSLRTDAPKPLSCGGPLASWFSFLCSQRAAPVL